MRKAFSPVSGVVNLTALPTGILATVPSTFPVEVVAAEVWPAAGVVVAAPPALELAGVVAPVLGLAGLGLVPAFGLPVLPGKPPFLPRPVRLLVAGGVVGVAVGAAVV